MIHWLDREQLQRADVVVIGAGAVGNELLKNLSLIGVGSIEVYDFDTIEPHNVTRSVLFRESDAGKPKAQTAANACKQLNPELTIRWHNENFWNILTLRRLREASAVFCCVDNFEARLKLNHLCKLLRVDFYNAGIDSRGVMVDQFPFRRNQHSACYECNLPNGIYEKIKERYSCGWLQRAAFKEEKIPTTIITASMAASAMLSLFLKSLGSNEPAMAQRWFLDTPSLHSTLIQYEKNEDCPVCSFQGERTFHVCGDRVPLNLPFQLPDTTMVNLSDAVILSIVCTICGKHSEPRALASDYDDTLAQCQDCRRQSNRIEIVDILPYKRLLKEFSSVRLPVKFLTFYYQETLHIVEIER
jgi:molybdopterin/thiamine biosynthesis adenylyltransferase